MFSLTDTFTRQEAFDQGILSYRRIGDPSYLDEVCILTVVHPRSNEYPEGYYLECNWENGVWAFRRLFHDFGD